MEDLIFDLTEIQASDILAHVDFAKKDIYQATLPSNLTDFSFPLDISWNAILKTTIQNKRQSDTDVLCMAVNGLGWEYKGKKVVSPLWLIPVSYKLNKVKQEIALKADPENVLFNPFVKNELKRRYGLSWEESPATDLAEKSADFYAFLREQEFTFEETYFVAFGNFHHHRYQIVRDLEALSQMELNPLVHEMLGNPATHGSAVEKLTNQTIVPADKDQKAVFGKIASGNLVIQGPPGTGKSQVLTNVLAKLLHQGKMNLVVSEKKAALEVLVKKLAVHGLDAFTFISHNQSKASDFIARLKKTWQMLETKPPEPERNLLLSEQLLSQLQLTLDKLASKNLIGGIGLSEFKKLLAPYDLNTIPYDSNVPSVAEWLEQKDLVAKLSEQLPSFQVLSNFKQQGLSEAVKLDQVLLELQGEFKKLTETLEFTTFGELELRIGQIARSQILENESYKKYVKLFSSQRERRKFEKLRITLLQQREAFALRQAEKQLWKNKPALSEAQSWKIQFSESWWKKRKSEKQVRAALTSNTVLPEVAVENWLHYLDCESALQSTISALQELGIERPEIEIESIHYLLKQLDQESSNALNEVAALPPLLRKQLIETGNTLQHAYRKAKSIINYDLHDSVLETIENALQNLPEILKVQQQLQAFQPQLYRLLQLHDSTEAIEKVILKSNWVQFESLFPELAKFDGFSLKSVLQQLIDTRQEENLIFGKNLLAARHQQFEDFHQLLRTPAAKLTQEEKAMKAVLKAGKSTLVKEFGKTKQHKTIRELLDSEARPWIELLTPVWLSTTTQVAVSFPMETALFEHVIFDEASQIPLSHALGSLQRAKRAIVAGDEQQMSPGNYFSGVSAGVDLLHQASYYWPKSPLKHHYRSMHPELISFSNRFFYNNELIAYPSTKQAEMPVRLHFIEQGIYDGRQNMAEAKAAAQHIQSMLGQAESIGIVAFSEQQLDCIWKQLPAETQNLLSQRMDDGIAFFKALEQVQGDECDRLIISLGYGRNPEGEFHMRFGPLNQKTGSKRLNVLLSRAKQSIDFFTSIKSSDLSLSTNEAINLLRFFLHENEESQKKGTIIFPFGLAPTVDENELTFEDLTKNISDAEELAVLQAVLQNRGWLLKYFF